jgi:anti-sigma factor RsiW
VTCRELASFLDDYLADGLPFATMEAFDRHLSACTNCRRYLASYRETIRLGKRAFDTDLGSVPRDVPEQLIQAILRARFAH